jgi:rhamnosyl/mannosyltransferase
VVSTNLPTGVPWVNQDGVSGFVVAPGDAGALAGAVARLGGDNALRARLGHAAAARAREQFSLAHMVRTFEDTVEQVVHAPAAGVTARAEVL